MEAATQTNGGDRFVGRPMKRREDPRFITGTGAYVDDLHVPGMCTRRSCARPRRTRRSPRSTPPRPRPAGRHRRLHADDLSFGGGIPMVWAPPGVDVNTPDHLPLKSGEVKCVGDPVAVVVARDKYRVVDAAER